MDKKCFVLPKVISWLICMTLSHILLYPHPGLTQMSDPEVLRVAIIPHRSNLGNEHAYSMFVEALEKETGLTFQWTGSKTYEDVIRKIGTKQADIGYVGAFGYVEARERYNVRLIARTYGKHKREFYHSMIITRADSGLSTLAELKGKSFIFNDPKSTSGFLFPMVALQEAGLKIEDFSKVEHVTKHANSLLAVYNGQMDSGAVSSTAKEKVDIDFNKIKVLWKSGPIYRGPWIANKDLSDDHFFRIQEAFLKISKYENAEDIFRGLGTKGFVRGLDSDYDNIRKVRSVMQALSSE